jgi:predicted DNA-binding transcriptional regulator YafY
MTQTRRAASEPRGLRTAVRRGHRKHAQPGGYELKVPYSKSRELLMDVLKYGPDAEVVAPLPLREEMKSLLHMALSGYQQAPR